MEPIRAKDATPEQVAQIRKNLARKKEDRKIEIEINEAINLANRKGKPTPRPTKAPAQKKKKALGLKKITREIIIVLYAIWIFFKKLSAKDWIFILTMFLIVYLFMSMI